jgi:hypothetical protein
MGSFLEREKINQTNFKANSSTISVLAKQEGFYKTKGRTFCLPTNYAEENLYPAIREPALEFFAKNKIKWHDGTDEKPSNHLCSSQVCCVNFLFPFADQPTALAELLRPIFPEIKKMLPVEDDNYVSFEWIGEQNYLGEKNSPNNKRTRGANFTSADAILMFENNGLEKHIVLIEWKYTESYFRSPLHISKSGTDRTAIYRSLFDAPNAPINKELIRDFGDLFYEPFYQLMRQQFLAHEMEKFHELSADIVSLMHISPDHNLDFKRITSERLRPLGNTATDAWNRLVEPYGRFMSVPTEVLFSELNPQRFPTLADWTDYINSRYSWVLSLNG